MEYYPSGPKMDIDPLEGVVRVLNRRPQGIFRIAAWHHIILPEAHITNHNVSTPSLRRSSSTIGIWMKKAGPARA